MKKNKFFRKEKSRFHFISVATLVFISLGSSIHSAHADDITLGCKSSNTTSALDFSSLGIVISPSTPVGTIIAEGTMTLQFKCGLDNLLQYFDGASSEVYFKRYAIADGALGYGLTIYTGFDGTMTAEASSSATGVTITSWAYTSGGTIGSYEDVTLSVPYQIIRTSNSMTASTLAGTVGTISKAFSVGSLVSGTDLYFSISNVKKNVTVKDETCSVASDSSQTVTLGSYQASKSSGLGSGIGQTSDATAFSIQLNCEALLSGTFDVMLQFDGDAVSDLSDSGVIALNSASTASGVGVQILDGDLQPVSLATPFNVASYPLSASLVTVPLYARYYQTASTVSAGSANAVATYTISYQ